MRVRAPGNDDVRRSPRWKGTILVSRRTLLTIPGALASAVATIPAFFKSYMATYPFHMVDTDKLLPDHSSIYSQSIEQFLAKKYGGVYIEKDKLQSMPSHRNSDKDMPQIINFYENGDMA